MGNHQVAEYAPGLHEALPWLRSLGVWDLIVRRRVEACFPNLSNLREFRETPDVFPSGERVVPSEPTGASAPTEGSRPRLLRPLKPSVPPGHSATAATLLSFFAGVTQPIAEMIESLFLSPWLLDPITVWEILRRMARAARVKPLPRNVVIGVCASLVRKRIDAMGRDSARHRLGVWEITWRPIPVPLRWPQQSQQPQQLRQPHSYGPSENKGSVKSFVVVVKEKTTCKAGGRHEPSGKILAFRCFPANPGNLGNPRHADYGNTGKAVTGIKPSTVADAPDLHEALETAMKLALYDALVFPLTASGELRRHLSPPSLLRVQAPIPKAIRQAACVWRIKVEEIAEVVQHEEDPERRTQSKRSVCSAQQCEWEWEQGKEQKSEWDRESEGECDRDQSWAWEWEEWERELANRILDPVHYLRILDRACERAYGYAPLLAKQRAVHQLGWRWHMFPHNDPLRYYPGLRELLPSFPATVGDDGTVEWQGWHYRDYAQDLLSYFPRAKVKVSPSPLAEAAILVYWKDAVLCYAVADELRHNDGSFRPYWYPYPRLGE